MARHHPKETMISGRPAAPFLLYFVLRETQIQRLTKSRQFEVEGTSGVKRKKEGVRRGEPNPELE